MLKYFLLASLVALSDQFTKMLVIKNIAEEQSIRVNAYFDFVHIKNPGAAFDFLSDADGWQRYFLSIVAVINYFNNIEPEGWTSIMIALLLIGGLIMFSLGIIGEYLGRLYLLSSNKPQYVVKEKIKKQ